MDEAAENPERLDSERLERHKDEEGVIGLRYDRNIVTVVEDEEEVEEDRLRVASLTRGSNTNEI